MAEGSATQDDILALRRDLIETERLLRDRDDEKEKGLRAEWRATFDTFRDDVAAEFTSLRIDLKDTASKEDVEDIKHRLSWQNKVWVVPAVSSFFLGVLYVFLHFAFHIG